MGQRVYLVVLRDNSCMILLIFKPYIILKEHVFVIQDALKSLTMFDCLQVLLLDLQKPLVFALQNLVVCQDLVIAVLQLIILMGYSLQLVQFGLYPLNGFHLFIQLFVFLAVYGQLFFQISFCSIQLLLKLVLVDACQALRVCMLDTEMPRV